MDTSTLVKIAWRNVWRNKRRAILTLLTIVVGCGMIIFNNALFYGGTLQMIDDSIALNSGHIQIQDREYRENSTLEYAMIPGRDLIRKLDRLKKEKSISEFSFRIRADAMIFHKGLTSGTVIQSIDPGRDRTVINIQKKVLPGGRTLKKNDRTQILIGESLAQNLNITVGQTLSMIAMGFDGSIVAERLTVVGLIKTGNPLFDQTLVMMPFQQMKESFAMNEFVNAVVIRLPSNEYAGAVVQEIKSVIDPGLMSVLIWDRLIPEIVQFVVFDRGIGYVFDFILFMVVAFTVLNTIQMSVYERTKEFGIMLSIGTRPGGVFSIIILESLFISIVGIALGIVLGLCISLFVEAHPFDYSSFSAEFAVWGVYTTVYPAKATAMNVIVSSIVTFVLINLFSLIPARAASRLEPVKAMRHL